MDDKKKASAERVQQINTWKKEHTERLSIEMNKELHMVDRINAAINAGYADSKQGFAVAAMEEKLNKLGF